MATSRLRTLNTILCTSFAVIACLGACNEDPDMSWSGGDEAFDKQVARPRVTGSARSGGAGGVAGARASTTPIGPSTGGVLGTFTSVGSGGSNSELTGGTSATGGSSTTGGTVSGDAGSSFIAPGGGSSSGGTNGSGGVSSVGGRPTDTTSGLAGGAGLAGFAGHAGAAVSAAGTAGSSA